MLRFSRRILHTQSRHQVFESSGQRIRLADAVLDQNLGTCMDMTLLYVACLEQMELNPVMILMNGHIFAGVWLVDESFSDIITPDPWQSKRECPKESMK